MNRDDVIWSYAEEFTDKILEQIAEPDSFPADADDVDLGIDPVIDEIIEIMMEELYKKDMRKVIEKMNIMMMLKVVEGELHMNTWTGIRDELTALLGL